jgi:serine/threonine protein phosphatase 1
MISSLRKLFGAQPAQPGPTVPAGERVYAVGDIHGRADLFAALIAAIDADDAARGSAKTTVVLLGDLVDRGPDSAGVVRLAREWGERRQVRLILGNHEEMLLESLEKRETLRHFLRYGGRETVLSYPIDVAEWNSADLGQAQAMMRAAIPAAHLDYFNRAEDMILIGDYLFVHAGIAPEVPLDLQRSTDLRWIREPFLSHRASHGPVVVHGHTITDKPEFRPNRIGIDTGAYQSGVLTALALEGSHRWLVEARDEEGTVSATTRIAA